MPNKVDDFIPFRLLTYVETQFKSISKALGYNTDVFVTDSLIDAGASQAKHIIYFVPSADDMQEQGIGGDPLLEVSLTIDIVGISVYETENPRRLSMSLEQDVRTALHSDIRNIRSSVARGCSFRFGTCTYDGGELAPNKEAAFRLQVNFTWSQRSDW